MRTLLFLADNGESYDEHREFQFSSALGDGLHLTLVDVLVIAALQQCKVFAWAPADAMHWLDDAGPSRAAEWIDLAKLVRCRWPADADAPTYWLEPEVAELPADVLAKVVRAAADATTLREGELATLRRHLDDVQAGRTLTVPIHRQHCRWGWEDGNGDLGECDCGYEWPREKG